MKKSQLESLIREVIRETIRKVDGKYVVYPEKGGKRLGTHSTKKAAEKQLTAIHLNKEGYVLQDLEDKFDIELDLHDDGKALTLSRIVIPKDKRGQGIGSKVMNLITQYADAQNKPIYLTPSKDFGATSTGRLEQFYKQFGFKKRDRSDFSTKETLVREPQTSENYADGKVKGKSRPGRVKKAGASCKGSVTDLRAKAKKYGGEKGKMYHWCANMKGGKK